jgi:hypothetical protein
MKLQKHGRMEIRQKHILNPIIYWKKRKITIDIYDLTMLGVAVS